MSYESQTKLSQGIDTPTLKIVWTLYIAFDPVDYSSADLDVSMAHPLSSDSMKGAAAESGNAAKKRGDRRRNKNTIRKYLNLAQGRHLFCWSS